MWMFESFSVPFMMFSCFLSVWHLLFYWSLSVKAWSLQQEEVWGFYLPEVNTVFLQLWDQKTWVWDVVLQLKHQIRNHLFLWAASTDFCRLLFDSEDLLLSHVEWKWSIMQPSDKQETLGVKLALCVQLSNKLWLVRDGRGCSALIASALRQVCIYSNRPLICRLSLSESGWLTFVLLSGLRPSVFLPPPPPLWILMRRPAALGPTRRRLTEVKSISPSILL